MPPARTGAAVPAGAVGLPSGSLADRIVRVQQRASLVWEDAGITDSSMEALTAGLEAVAADLDGLVTRSLDDLDVVRVLQATRDQLGGHLLAASDLAAVDLPEARVRSLLGRAAVAVDTGLARALAAALGRRGRPSAHLQGPVGDDVLLHLGRAGADRGVALEDVEPGP